MKTLVVGSGGREHALAWKLAGDASVDELISAPGNPGTAQLGQTFDVAADDIEGLASLAEEQEIDLTVVGPEIPLVAGIADLFASRGLRVFGPSQAAAEIEGSKVFCRELAMKVGAPMAQGETFSDPEAAAEFARTIAAPMVVKADGLAAGKGVLICDTQAEAVNVIDRMMREDMFGTSGHRVLVEEFLEGRETSLLCLTDGTNIVPLQPAQDYKRIGDGDTGLNTGGMGAYSPVPWLKPELLERAVQEIVRPMVDGLAEMGRPYRGCFYAGLMFTKDGPKLIEVNCRFGDPETQALMPRLVTDLGSVLSEIADGELKTRSLEWSKESSVSVVVAANGYPEEYPKGLRISGLDDAESDGAVVFHAGTAHRDGHLVSTGGRVLNVSALGASIADARARAYAAVDRVRRAQKSSRSDIAANV